MSKPDQILYIEPQSELRFRGPFKESVTSYMKLTNPSDRRVIFKIKTTAPKKYCVRPNSGILEPNSILEIAISLQPFVFDPAEKNKHKFMVQTLFAPDGDFNLDQLWKDISPEQLMDSKLKCVFEMPMEQNDSQEEASPKLYATTNVTSATALIDSELQKAAEEVQLLREEESSLRQENLRIKEELIQLKFAAGQRVNAQPNRYAPPIQQQSIPVAFVVLAVILAFFGVLLGKYIL